MIKIVWTLIVTLLLFTAIVMICNINDIEIQDSLITGFIAVLSAELATMGGIKMVKVRREQREAGNRDQAEAQNTAAIGFKTETNNENKEE